MSWDCRLDANLTAADDSMAKIKERLYTRGDVTKDLRFDSPPVRRGGLYCDKLTNKPASPYTPSAYTHTAQVSSEDMVNLSSQLLSQAKMITSLHQTIGRLEQDRDLHLQLIQRLEDEVRRLGASRGLDVSESLLERKMEGLRQEMFSELCHLEDRVRDSFTRSSSPSLRSAAVMLLEVNENKRLIQKDYESLRRDTDYMQQRLRRQDDDLLRQISDGQELKRAQEKNATVLERILSGHQWQTQERACSDIQGVQRELLQIRSSIRDLRDNVRILEGKVSTHRARSDQSDCRRCVRSQSLSSSGSSSSPDVLGSLISLADISSEDTPCTLSAAVKVSRESSRTRRSQSDLSDDSADDLSDSAPELNFSDL